MNDRKYIHLLDSLCSLTESAIQYARQDNPGPAMRCIRKRARLLSEIRDMHALDNRQGEMRIRLCALLERSEVLRSIIQESMTTAQKKLDRVKQMNGVRRRFAGKRSLIPKFIDRRI